jgi:DNA-directed RNA polymerase subunit M
MKLRLKFKSPGALYCPTCSYKKEFPEDYVPQFHESTKIADDDIVVVDQDLLALLAYPTLNIYCEVCGHRKAEIWSVAFGSGTLGSITYFRCVNCGHTWRDIE